jgi:hypothetical protein
VRDEPSRRKRKDTRVVTALTGNRGDGGALIDFVGGKQSPMLRGGLMVSVEGGEAFGRVGVR